ncbi:pyrroline-5-carboxylate reductase [Bacillus suaedae]|uniref:Pyrroline-5-carboxylate reductase n=1 Tax=Halalkalibacter suaedae TaxID=2822140 RepID=A0A940X0W0_9BACI|nr:pyrroline-5-carboxylate reductase [Bacillus suaedae]MBP3952389.1 pyrroline-5-carboxylate reductase [Bacillus suaedae]
MNILFIGAGRMAEAIFSGLLEKDQTLSITISNFSNQQKLQKLQEKYAVHTTLEWENVVKSQDVILLACPPHEHSSVLAKLRPLVSEGQLVITVAAGIGPSYLEEHLPSETAVAWLMPNTAAAVGKSMSIYAYGQHVTDSQKQRFSAIVSAIGPSEELNEEQVHQLTAITGSAPAFLYYFTEALEKAALNYGISSEQARKLVIEMIIGSAAMLDVHRDPSLLREQVTSPGGATAAGIASLDHDHFSLALQRAIEATNNHAKKQGQN